MINPWNPREVSFGMVVEVTFMGCTTVRSGHTIFTVPETAGIDLGDVPPALVASMVYV